MRFDISFWSETLGYIRAMEIHAVGLFITLLCAAYVQSMTGFAFGMITMGAVILFGLAPITEIAIIISISGFVNSAMGLWRYRSEVDWRRIWPLMLIQGPFVFVGVELLIYLSQRSVYLLELMMGLVVMLASIILIAKPPKLTQTSNSAAFTVTGAASGLLTGVFAAGGPPLIYLLYRQPWAVSQIKACLFAIFTLSTILRTTTVTVQGDMTFELILWGMVTMPIIYVGTMLGTRYPLPMQEHQQKTFAFVLFGLMGVLLATTGAAGLV